jgi:glycosyltransferase involved in cell wall biosynthesis
VELAYRALAPVTASALAISQSVKEFATEHMGFASDEVEVLNYPLPRYSFYAPTPEQIAALRREYGIAPSDPVIGAVTRFFPSKGIRYLVDAFADVAKQLPDARLVLVGQGPEEDALRQRSRELGIEQRVIFAGFQREAHLFAGMFDVAVVPSLEEGFGLVALESLALGVPVIASRRGGLPDIVIDGETGILVEPMQPDAIRDAILRILGDPDLHRRMSAAARTDAQRFSLDRYVGRLLEIYRSLASGKAAGNRRQQRR